jgi:hypothetical protein
MPLFTSSLESLGSSLVGVGLGLLSIIPVLFIAVLIAVIGFFIANVLGKLVFELVKTLKLDTFFTKLGMKDALGKLGVHLDSATFLSQSVKWLVVVSFLITSFNLMGLTQITRFLGSVLGFIPQVITAGVILIITSVAAEFIRKIISSSAKVAEFGASGFAGSIAKGATWVFGIIIVLQVLGLPTSMFQIVITGIVAGLSLAFGLAFGLGGRDVASKILDKTYNNMTK